MPLSKIDIEEMFCYHSPKGDQAERYRSIRDAGYLFAKTILDLTPPGADQTCAVRHIRDACMTANASIAIGEAVVSSYGYKGP